MRRWTCENAELREYEPGYRTLFIAGNQYTIFFPYMVFVLRSHLISQPYRYEPQKVKTLHLGLRTKPLPNTNIMDESLMYPSLPNMYCKWLLVCCPPGFDYFWGSMFNHYDWPGYSLLNSSRLKSFERWQTMNPDYVMSVFQKWPKEMLYSYDPIGGLWPGNTKIMPLLMSINECVHGDVYFSAIHHVNVL